MSGLHAAVERFVADTVLPQVEAWDRADELPRAALEELARLGVAGALVPAAYGGPGLGVADLVPVWRTLSHGWISLTGAVNPTGLATALLVRHGTEAQRRAWLPGIARGAVLASFSITEPQAGSDLGPDRDGRAAARGRRARRSTARSAGSRAARPRRSSSCSPRSTASRRASCSRPTGAAGDGLGGRGARQGRLPRRRVRRLPLRRASRPRAPRCSAATPGAGRAPDARRARRRARQRRLPRARHPRPLHRLRGGGVAPTREVGDGLLGDHTHAQLRVGELIARRVVVEAARGARRRGGRRARRRGPRAVDGDQGVRVRHGGVGGRRSPRGWPPAAPTRPATSWPACAATRRRRRSARAPTTRSCWRSRGPCCAARRRRRRRARACGRGRRAWRRTAPRRPRRAAPARRPPGPGRRRRRSR